MRASVRFKPFDNFDVTGVYQHFTNDIQQFDQVESANLADPSLAAAPVALTARNRSSVEDVSRLISQTYDTYNLRAEWRFAGQKLNYVGAFSDQFTSTRDPNDKGNYFGSTFSGNPASANDPFSTTFATVPNFQNASQFNHTPCLS